jgi:radical SAM family uncharacterized protein
MNEKLLQQMQKKVASQLLPRVKSPSRYIGGEINQIKKPLPDTMLTFALCFPDIYEIGSSNTGFAVLYEVINALPFAAAQRCFAPWLDAENIMRKKNIPLFTLESKAPLSEFDIIGFSLTNELCITNMLNMLDLAKLPLKTADRTDDHPLIVAGGQMANSAEPIAPFADIFILGQGENAIVEFLEFYKSLKQQNFPRRETLEKIARQFDFAYVPSLYEFEYTDNKIKTLRPLVPNLPTTFKNAFINEFDSAPAPTKPIVPFTQAVHERVSVEIMRGCPGRCRFCQASFCRRPIRYRSPEKIFEIAKKSYQNTGFDTVSLLSLSTADYPYLEQTIEKLQNYFTPLKVGLSLPSLKVQAQLELLPKLVNSVRKSGLTIAVEAATEKLRKIINKPITDQHLFAAVAAAYSAGFQSLKLYFMTGYPGEKEKDIEQIVDLCNNLSQLRKECTGPKGTKFSSPASINISVSFLVPKPHTPFAFIPAKSREYFQKAKQIIIDRKRVLRASKLRFKFHSVQRSCLETVIARADRRIAPAIKTAFDSGAKFDLWDECFDFQTWQNAFAAHGLDIDKLAQQSFNHEDKLPWEHLGSPSKDMLIKHYNNAIQIAES